VQAHIASDNGERKRVEVSAMGALDWYPIAFIVIVREDRDSKPGRLLFVYADDEKDCEMDKFFFKVEDNYMMLSSLSFGDEYLARSKEMYNQEAKKLIRNLLWI
jgi:hypothetical protein